MTAPVLQVKRGVLSNLPGLRAGEPAFTTDTFDLFVGIDSTTNNNKFVGSHRYWTKETASKGSGINLVEATGGSDYITLAAPASVGAAVTYTFPESPTDGYFLKTNSTGTLSWAEVVSTFDIAADSGTTDTVSTGSTVSFTGGTNVNTAVTDDTITINLDNEISITNLNVSGVSTFVGVATFTTSNVYIDNQLYVGGINIVGGATLGEDISARHLTLSGIATVAGLIDANGGLDVFGHSELDNLNVSGVTTTANLTVTSTSLFQGGIQADSLIFANGGIQGDLTGNVTGNLSGNVNSSGINTLSTANITSLSVSGVSTFTGLVDANGGLDVAGHSELDDLNVSGITTTGTLKLAGTSGIGITGISASTSLVEDSDDYLPTQKAVKAYVDAIDFDDDLGIAGDTGTGTVDLDSQSLGIYGTANEIETVGSGTSITIGLPDTVNVTTKIDVPTIEVTDVKARDGSSAITISDSTGAVGFANNVTVNGDLYVLGTTTEVNTSSLKVEDTLIDLGLINDSGSLVPPSSDLNLDIGVLLNWYSDSAKKASVFWDDSAGRIGIASDVTEAAGVLTVNNWAAIEIGALWVNDCAGQSQVISCTDSERFLENITVDAGTF